MANVLDVIPQRRVLEGHAIVQGLKQHIAGGNGVVDQVGKGLGGLAVAHHLDIGATDRPEGLGGGGNPGKLCLAGGAVQAPLVGAKQIVEQLALGRDVLQRGLTLRLVAGQHGMAQLQRGPGDGQLHLADGGRLRHPDALGSVGVAGHVMQAPGRVSRRAQQSDRGQHAQKTPFRRDAKIHVVHLC